MFNSYMGLIVIQCVWMEPGNLCLQGRCAAVGLITFQYEPV